MAWTRTLALILGGALCLITAAHLDQVRAQPVTDPDLNDIPAKIAPMDTHYDYDKRVVMIPMRDGVKLYTVMLIPRGRMARP